MMAFTLHYKDISIVLRDEEDIPSISLMFMFEPCSFQQTVLVLILFKSDNYDLPIKKVN